MVSSMASDIDQVIAEWDATEAALLTSLWAAVVAPGWTTYKALLMMCKDAHHARARYMRLTSAPAQR